jgi:hypothetical protein
MKDFFEFAIAAVLIILFGLGAAVAYIVMVLCAIVIYLAAAAVATAQMVVPAPDSGGRAPCLGSDMKPRPYDVAVARFIAWLKRYGLTAHVDLDGRITLRVKPQKVRKNDRV